MRARNGAAWEQGKAAATWLFCRAGMRVLTVALLAFAGLFAFTVYETAWLGLPVAREEPASFDVYHIARSAFVLLVSGLLVAALVRARARPCALDIEAIRGSSLAVGLAVFAAALAATALLVLDPAAFHVHAQEDRPLEWASAGLLLAAGGLFACNAARRTRARGGRNYFAFFIATSLCLLLVVMAMEEISWGQRLLGFATPEPLAEVNWQGEFNFHNIQTDLTETVYYSGAAIFLLFLPLLRELVPPSVAAQRLWEFVPRRSVALVAAPLAFLNYGHWNLLPVQVGTTLALFVLLVFAFAAHKRGGRAEQAVFLAAAIILVAGQALLLAYGSVMTELPDSTEYKELFIAVGFAWYALTMVRRPARI